MLHSPHVGSRNDLRSAPRLTGTFWVQIEGIDQSPVLRTGNISRTGIMFEGLFNMNVGALELIHIASRDKLQAITIMARAVRVNRASYQPKNLQPFIAFVFLPDGESKRKQLEALVRYMGVTRDARESWRNDVLGTMSTPNRRTPSVSDTKNVAKIEIETNWIIPTGEKVQLVLPSQGPEGTIFEGVVSGVTEADAEGRYRVCVNQIHEGASDVYDEPVTEDIRLEDVEDADDANRQLLTGHLDRIALPSLLTWFELERMTGVMVVEDGDRGVSVFLKEGAILDIEMKVPETPDPSDMESALGRLFGWSQGQFTFYEKPIECADRFGMSTTGLILEHFRMEDEATREPMVVSTNDLVLT